MLWNRWILTSGGLASLVCTGLVVLALVVLSELGWIRW